MPLPSLDPIPFKNVEFCEKLCAVARIRIVNGGAACDSPPEEAIYKVSNSNTIEAAIYCFKCSAQSARIECYRSRNIVLAMCLAGISMVLPSFIKCAMFAKIQM